MTRKEPKLVKALDNLLPLDNFLEGGGMELSRIWGWIIPLLEGYTFWSKALKEFRMFRDFFAPDWEGIVSPPPSELRLKSSDLTNEPTLVLEE